MTHRTDKCSFIIHEAKQLMEFCIELNNQDDRNEFPEVNEFKANLGNWDKVYDSRDENDVNPATNGFGPFENAWILLRNQGETAEYALAIRGTIGQAKSVLNDLLATTIAANSGIEFPKNKILPIVFAETPGAEVYLGFAYAVFTLLFNKDKGILKLLQSDQVPSGAQLMITGHCHAGPCFLHYAVTGPNDKYGLKTKQLKLKSYVFAQPKPGNYQFAMDFAHIAGSRSAGFVINNSLDPVTMLPLSSETLAESISRTLDENRMQGTGAKGVLIKGAAIISKGIFMGRNKIAELISDKVAKLYHEDEMKNIDTHYFEGTPPIADTPVKSLNYTLSGALVPLFRIFKGGKLYPSRQEGSIDILLQHHATTYRKLLQQQFNEF